MSSQSILLSNTLREIGGGRSTRSSRCICQEEEVKEVQNEIVKFLNKTYPELGRFTHRSSIYKKSFCQYNPELEMRNLSNKNSHIKPDGGFIILNDHPPLQDTLFTSGKHPSNMLILSIEAKNQGTNHIREQNGEKLHAQGNAIERAYKNYQEILHLTRGYPYIPIIYFVSGSDFKEGSSIRDRLTGLTAYQPTNPLTHYM